jgi:UPF0271 protein
MKSSKLPKINCDLGEGVQDEEKVFSLIDYASIACGGHFGNETTISQSLIFAKESGVKVGAHPSYPDQESFGRKTLQIEFTDLTGSLKEQVDRFNRVAANLDLVMDHIKFHGALYNDAMSNADLAQNLCKWLSENHKSIPIFVSPSSQMLFWAEQFGLKTRLEVFGDRAYLDNYRLQLRSEENSLFSSLDRVKLHIQSIIEQNQIITASGKKIPVEAKTLCFHGDNPGLMDFLPILREKYWK